MSVIEREGALLAAQLVTSNFPKIFFWDTVYILSEVGTFCRVLLSVPSETCPVILYEIGL